MSFVRRHAVPLAAGLAAAVTAFAVVAATSGGGGPAPDAPASPAQGTGLEVFTRIGCGGCHRLAAAGSSGPVGPDLDARLPDHTRESLTAAILTPPSGSIMPPDFGRRMSKAELANLVDFLLSTRAPR